jgi:plasmid stabilization system protein ParE
MAHSRPDVIFSPHAENALRMIIQDVQEVSLLSAEKLRKKILHKIHLIQHQPNTASKKVTLSTGVEVRCATVMHYKIFYTIEETQILILEFLAEKLEKPV